MDEKRALLRHTVATVAYRGGKAVRGAPASFAAFSGDQSDRTAARILAHIGDLFDWALSQAKGAEAWHDSTPLEWDREVERFHAVLRPVEVVVDLALAQGFLREAVVPGVVFHEQDFHGRRSLGSSEHWAPPSWEA